MLTEKKINEDLRQYLYINNIKKIGINAPSGNYPFCFGNKNNLNEIKTFMTNAFISCLKRGFPKINPMFINKFIEALNIIHLNLSLPILYLALV